MSEIKNQVVNMKKALLKILQNGIFSVAAVNVLNKAVALICNIVIVRMVSQYEYGLYGSANNIIEIVLLFTGLGALSGGFQYGTEKRSDGEKEQYYKFCLSYGCLIDVVLIVLVLASTWFGVIPIKATQVYVYMLVPTVILHYFYEYCGMILRSSKEINKYASLLNFNSATLSIFSCIGAFLFNVNGLIIGRLLAYLVSCILGIMLNKKRIRGIVLAEELSIEKKREVRKFSLESCVIGALNRMMHTIDITMIGYIIRDPSSVAIYKVGIQIPEAMEFLPQSVLVALMPHFVENNGEYNLIEKWTYKLYLYLGVVNLFITMLLVGVGPYIVIFLWGEHYSRSVPVFIIMSLNYFVMATFRLPGTNILIALRKTSYNVKVSMITCIVNVSLNWMLIHYWGINGAACATLLSMIIASSFSFIYLIKTVRRKD